MASSINLEHYLDSLENLPIELQRNFTLMHDLDARSQDVVKEIDKASNEYLSKVRDMPSEKRKEQLSKIQKLWDKAKEYADDKVQLSVQTYELVDKHIRRLDSDLARFEAEIKEKARVNAKVAEVEGTTTGKKGGRKKGKAQEKKKGRLLSSDEDLGKGRKKSKKGTGTTAVMPSQELAITSVFPLSTGHASDVLDMPVDPNEPTYCICQQVSYGEMIGCDNPDCPIEWFHFGCVELTTKPKGKWYCPRCSPDRKKK